MGVVYRARHLALDQPRALKLIDPSLAADPEFRSRFEREARLAASVDSEHVVTVHHAGVEDGRLFLSMRLVRGRDLGSLVEEDGPLTPTSAAAVLDQVAEGLDAAHAAGLIHRDVKPSNILIEEGGERPRAFLSDFGISGRDAPDYEGRPGPFLGTPDYVAPEQLEGGQVTKHADIYALGGVAHYMLTGAVPFPDRPEPAKLVAHSKAPRPTPSSLAAVPRAVDEVVARAMSTDPHERYGSGQELASAFRHALGVESSRPRRLPALAWAIAAVTLAAVVTTVLMLSDSETTTELPQPTEKRSGTVAEVAGRTKLAGRPVSIAPGTLKMWVTTSEPAALTGIDPATGAVDPGPLPLGQDAALVSVATGFGSIWVLDAAAQELLRVEPRDQLVSARIPIGGNPTEVIAGGAWLWVAQDSTDDVVRVNPQTNAVDTAASLPAAPGALAYNDGTVYAALPDAGRVARIDANSGVPAGDSIDTGGSPKDLAVGRAGLWALDADTAAIRLVDLEASRPRVTNVPVDAGVTSIATGLGSVWAVSPRSGTVSRIREGSRELLGELPTGATPSGLSTGFGSVWVADSQAETVAQLTP